MKHIWFDILLKNAARSLLQNANAVRLRARGAGGGTPSRGDSSRTNASCRVGSSAGGSAGWKSQHLEQVRDDRCFPTCKSILFRRGNRIFSNPDDNEELFPLASK